MLWRFTPLKNAFSPITEKSPFIILLTKSSALCFVLSSLALISIVIRDKTEHVFNDKRVSAHKTPYLPKIGNRLFAPLSFLIRTPSTPILYVLFSCKYGFATMYSVGRLYASGTPPQPPVKAYKSPFTLVTNTLPLVCKSVSSSTCGIVSGSPV